MRNKKIVTYYSKKQVLEQNIDSSYSKSPMKPKLVMSELMKAANCNVRIQPMFKPFKQLQFETAHTKNYVNEVFNFNKPGTKLSSSIPWSKELVTSLTYTTSSLYHAIKHSILKSDDITFAPVSGFHHARPNSGSGFCTFSGQVIASVKIYNLYKKVGCYLDLDGHYGNSIEDTRNYCPTLNKAIPVGFNFNPTGTNKQYASNLSNYLYTTLKESILSGDIDYVVWCHGADSHLDDDLGGQVTTKYWLECSKIFWSWVKHMDLIMGKSLPVSMTLFGGYREDDYQSVINLHVSDIIIGLNCLTDSNINYTTNYTKKDYEDFYSNRRKF